MFPIIVAIALTACPLVLNAQFEPEGAHVNLYFPHLADGGTSAQQWQTAFLFTNPNTTLSANVALNLYANDGLPLSLDLGSGLRSTHSFTIPPQGTRTLRSRIASALTVAGWALAYASTPVQATVLFRAIQNGIPQVEISAAATLPSPIYRSAANRSLGVAVANVYTNITVGLTVTALDSNGNRVGTGRLSLPPLGHSSFNLSSLIPSLPASYSGSIMIESDRPIDNFVAWTLNSEGGVLSSLPPGPMAWPISHWDRIWLAYTKIFNAAQTLARDNLGVDLSNPPVRLRIDPTPVINASASSDNDVQINLALSELISDSPGELAFIIGHELGHIIQFRKGAPLFLPNPEIDADQLGMLFCLAAGFDPYSGAGALAKMSMANNQSGCCQSSEDVVF
jgi:Zn-dependent protease with chaperone function